MLTRRAFATVAIAASIFVNSSCQPSKTPHNSGGGGNQTPPAATQTQTTPPAPPPTTPPNQAAGLSGTWTGTWANSVPDHSTGAFTVVWTQSGANLSGTITITGTPCLTGGSITGTVGGSTISFGAVNGQVHVDYTGVISGSTMAGTYATDCGNARGSWQATKK
jgi:hypothetical protein